MSSSSQVTESWVASFCGLLGHEYFAEVSEDFIEDDFNLTGLQSQVPMYKEALEMILDVEPEDDEEDEEEEEEDEDEDEVLGDERGAYRRASERRHLRIASDLSVIESSAELLYGLIHQRYITSRPGIQQMAEKYELQHFGTCPRVNCNSCKVLPVGLNDSPGHETVKLFCPSCLDVYTPPNSRFQTVDGAFFGTTFPSLFFMTFTDLDISGGLRSSASATVDALAQLQAQNADAKARNNTTPANVTMINGVAPNNLAPGLGVGSIYEPRIYGFRVSERARSGPRMKWLRMRPADVTELDETRRYWDERAEDEDRPDEDDMNMVDLAEGGKPGIPANRTRKQARTRRRPANGAQPDGSPMDTNGVTLAAALGQAPVTTELGRRQRDEYAADQDPPDTALGIAQRNAYLKMEGLWDWVFDDGEYTRKIPSEQQRWYAVKWEYLRRERQWRSEMLRHPYFNCSDCYPSPATTPSRDSALSDDSPASPAAK